MVTEVDKIDNPVISTPEQFSDLFDFSNLTHQQKDLISKIMIEMKQVFALLKYDLGRCNASLTLTLGMPKIF